MLSAHPSLKPQEDVPKSSIRVPYCALCEITACRTPLERSLLSPLQMSLSLGDGAGEIGSDDGDRDEPAGDRSGSHSAGRRGGANYGARSCPTAADHTAPSVPITQGLSDRWSHGLGVAPARQAQQPLLPSGAADRGAGADHRPTMPISARRSPARSSPSGTASIWVSRRSGAG